VVPEATLEDTTPPPRKASLGAMAAFVAASRGNAAHGPLVVARSRPVRKPRWPVRSRWPIVLVAGVVLGVGAGAIALVWFGDHKDADTAGTFDVPLDAPAAPVAPPVTVPVVAPPADAPPPDAPPPDAEPIDVPPDAPSTVQLDLVSTPPGATVFDAANSNLGVTPLTVAWPPSPDRVTFRFELAGYLPRLADIVVDGDAPKALHVDLERDRKKHPHPQHPRH
jgi:hypothetical protein